jgi:hypothetical protein
MVRVKSGNKHTTAGILLSSGVMKEILPAKWLEKKKNEYDLG